MLQSLRFTRAPLAGDLKTLEGEPRFAFLRFRILTALCEHEPSAIGKVALPSFLLELVLEQPYWSKSFYRGNKGVALS